MSTLTEDLQAILNRLDAGTASRLARVVRDAMDLAESSASKVGEVDANGWPIGYFEKTAGCMAGEEWDIPVDPPAEPCPIW